MENSMLEGLRLMIVGMSVVFSFLALMVGAMTATARLLQGVADKPDSDDGGDALIAAAIAVAASRPALMGDAAIAAAIAVAASRPAQKDEGAIAASIVVAHAHAQS